MKGFRESVWWQIGLSAYWFATSYKWFVLLLLVLSKQVAEIVPGGEKNTAWGTVFMIGAIWAVIGPSVFGYLSDRCASRFGRRRPFIAIGAGLTVIALGVLSQAQSLPAMIVGYLLLQVSDDVGTGPYGALIPELVPESKRGRASGYMGIMTLLAQIASAIVAVVLGSNLLAIYAAIAAVNVVCALWVLWTLRDVVDEPPKAERSSFLGFIRGWREPWRSRDFRWVWFTRFLNALGFYMVQPYLYNYLSDRVVTFKALGLDLGKASTAVLALGLTISLFGAMGAMWATRAADRIGRKRVIYIAGTIMFAVLVPFALVPQFPVIWGLSAIFGIGYGAYQSADWALASDVLPNMADAGKDMGVWVASISCVQIVAGGIGRAIDAGNQAAPGLGYIVVFLLASGVFLLSTVLVRQVRGST